MESNRVLIAALLFIIVIIGVNYALYIIARNWAKGGDSRWMSAIRNSLSKPMEGSASKSMDELRDKMKTLEDNKKEE
jgi:steroid 5-alpha reductase family enzyme